MTASDTAMWLRKELEFARAAVRRQRAISKTQRQLLRRIADRHRRGDSEGVAWHIERWPELLEKWVQETMSGAEKRDSERTVR